MKLVCLSMLFSLMGCYTFGLRTDCEPNKCESFDALVIASKSPTPNEIILHPGGLHLGLPDNVEPVNLEIGVDINTDKIYLLREGHTLEGDCRISRTELTVDGSLFLMRMPGTTETCSGTGCDHCSFKKGGGCECISSLNICEHTISKNKDFFNLNRSQPL